MSVIDYSAEPERIGNIYWATQVALEQMTGTLVVPGGPGLLEQMEKLAIKPRGVFSATVGDERVYWLEYSPLAPRLLVQALIAANAEAWSRRAGGNDPGLVVSAVDRVRKPIRPEGVTDGQNELRAAWTILTALRYNVDESTCLGRFAHRAITRLAENLAYQVMHVDVEGF